MVGYLEEKAVESYSEYLAQMDATGTSSRPAPAVAVKYWHMPATATLRDVVSRIRDDECRHRDVNHELADQVARGHRTQVNSS
jgi:ubiquinol oxidase